MFRDQGQPSLSEGHSLHASRPSGLYAQAQSGDDTPFRKQACTEYTRWVFCKLFRRHRERHLACPTRMHGSRPLSFQGFILNHGLLPPPYHLFGRDTGIDPSLMLNHWFEVFLHENSVSTKFLVNTLDIEEFSSNGSLVRLQNHYESGFLLIAQIFCNDDGQLIVTFQKCVFDMGSLSTHVEEETSDEESFDPIPKTPKNTDDEGNGEENLGTNVGREEGQDEEDEADELYRYININLGRGIQLGDVHSTQEVEVSHVTLTPVNPDGQQQSSSVSSQFVTSMLNPTPDAGMESIFETTSQMDVQTPTSRMNKAVKVAVQIQSDHLRDEAQKENDEFLKTIDENMQKIIKEQVKEQVNVQVSKILPNIEQTVNEQLKAKVLTRSSNSSKTSYAVATDLSEIELKKILIEKMEGNKSIQRSNEQRNLYKALVEAYESDNIILDTYGDTVTLKRRRDDDADKDEEPRAGSYLGSKRRREGKEHESASAPKEKATRSAGKSTQGSKYRQTSESESATPEEPTQTTFEMEEPSHPEFETGADDQQLVQSSQHPKYELAKQSDSRSSFNELMDTPVDFSNFLMNRLKVDTLTPKLLAGPTYELMKGSCKSLVELEFLLEEVYKATTDQLDWVNPEGQQYPHNLLKPLPLIPNNRGHRVIPFDHFINNDLEYFRVGASSRKTMWIQEPIGYDKHALWGIFHWGHKRQQFYGFIVNRESARDVYSKRRIIAVTELKIVEWHNYKNLDWITMRKLTNLTVEERFAFNVSLRMFTRSIVIQRRVEDLQLGVESYQKKLNLTKPNTYRSDLQSGGKVTKDKAAAMIQAIDKRIKTRRIMRSLERAPGTITPWGLALTPLPALWYRRKYYDDGVGGRVAKPTPR
uniref:Uncharacterized protein n=1 Tax=Tanacetum cinerariifolium TaxID=118510 RepID=A0A6L2LY44_TANCI|nr:hypothetical protein [Tanacetum cinerariifolium]